MAWHPFRNFGLKVVALFLGALLWFTVSGQQAESTIPGVPVVYRNKPADLELTEQSEMVDLHVRGLDSQLRGLQPRDFEARVDLAGARAGSLSLPLRIDQVSSPPGVVVTRVDPGSVFAVLEQSGTATLPIVASVEGTPAPGFVVSEQTVEPQTVTVIGPARRIAATTSAITDRVDINGASANVSETVSVGVPDPMLRLRESRSARVTVKIERADERTFPAARVNVRNLGVGLRATIEPAVVLVIARGARSLVERLSLSAVEPYVDVSSLGRGRHEVPVLIDAMGTLEWNIRPATVTVIIN